MKMKFFKGLLISLLLTFAFPLLALAQAPMSVVCVVGTQVYPLQFEGSQLRFYMDQSLSDLVKKHPSRCEGSFSSYTTFKLNSVAGQITVDGRLVQSGNELILSGYSFLIWYQPGPSNGLDVWIQHIGASAPIQQLPVYQPPISQPTSILPSSSIVATRPYASCNLYGQQNDLEYDKGRLFMDPWLPKLQEAVKIQDVICFFDNTGPGGLLEIGSGNKKLPPNIQYVIEFPKGTQGAGFAYDTNK